MSAGVRKERGHHRHGRVRPSACPFKLHVHALSQLRALRMLFAPRWRCSGRSAYPYGGVAYGGSRRSGGVGGGECCCAEHGCEARRDAENARSGPGAQGTAGAGRRERTILSAEPQRRGEGDESRRRTKLKHGTRDDVKEALDRRSMITTGDGQHRRGA